jgi:hypothetical protein
LLVCPKNLGILRNCVLAKYALREVFDEGKTFSIKIYA